MAQNPFHLVAPQLQNHVHLISGHRFPHLPSLNLEQAFRYLIDAPTIVKQTAPMSWQYVQPPPDGTAWLEWIPPRQNQSGGSEYRFASDGYIWADPEQSYRSDFGGYTIEWMQHTLGYKLGGEQVASHARTRFHFVSKNPGVNAPPPDPSLWIVHYHAAEQGRMMPIGNIPVSQGVRQQVQERRWLETQGRLERRDFMLHDREHWPSITVPQQQQQQPGMYGNSNMMMQQQQQMMAAAAAAQAGGGGIPRFPQHHQTPSFSSPNNQPGGPPPAKRPRTSSTLAGGALGPEHAHAVGADTSIEDEENQLLDYFDHLTPRDISYARYIQHHRWMEEVFSSPYSTSSIVPPDLGMGLMGELKGLTEGLLDPPASDDTRVDVRLDPNPYKRIEPGRERQRGGDGDGDGRDRAWKEWVDKPGDPREPGAFTNLGREKVEEFNKRVEKHLADTQAEIERMKEEHVERMKEWKKSKVLMQAEKRLRYATWEGHEDAVPQVLRLEVDSAANGHHAEDDAARETVEDVVKDVEGLLGVKVRAYQDATMMQKGGLEREEEVEREDGTQEMEMQGLETQQKQPLGGDSANGLQNGLGQPLQQQSAVSQQAPAQQITLPVPVNEPSALRQQLSPPDNNASPQVLPPQQQSSVLPDDLADPNDQAFDDITDMDQMQDDTIGDTSLMNMDDMDNMDMDMDMDTGEIDFVQHDEDEFDDSLAGTPGQPPTIVNTDPVAVAEQQPPQLDALTAAGDGQHIPGESDLTALAQAQAEEEDEDLFGEVDPTNEGDMESESLTAPALPGEVPEPAAPLELPVQSEESAIPAMEAEASLGNEPDVSATTLPTTADTDITTLPTTGVEIPPAVADTLPMQPTSIEQQSPLEEIATPPRFDPSPAAAAEAAAAENTLGEASDLFDDGTFDDLPDMGGDVDVDVDVGQDEDQSDLVDFGGGLEMGGDAFGDDFAVLEENGQQDSVPSEQGGA